MGSFTQFELVTTPCRTLHLPRRPRPPRRPPSPLPRSPQQRSPPPRSPPPRSPPPRSQQPRSQPRSRSAKISIESTSTTITNASVYFFSCVVSPSVLLFQHKTGIHQKNNNNIFFTMSISSHLIRHMNMTSSLTSSLITSLESRPKNLRLFMYKYHPEY